MNESMDKKTEAQTAAYTAYSNLEVPTVSCRYRHFKGGLYVVVQISVLESDPDVLLVTYASGKHPLPWTRTLRDFTEVVEWPDGVQRPRFVREGRDGT